MEKLNIRLDNCHGITSFRASINFKDKKSCLIYASNGTMKTSFTNTFKNLCDGEKEKLRNKITNKNSIVKININDEDKPLKSTEEYKENFFVIESLIDDYDFNHISKILINQDLKQEYQNIYKEIGKLEENLVKKLKRTTKLKNNNEIKNIFCEDFCENDFLEGLLKIKNEIEEDKYTELNEIKYQHIFNEKTSDILENNEIMEKLSSFSDSYNNLVNESSILNTTFTHNSLKKLSKDLGKNGFFDIKHEIVLNDKNNPKNGQTRFISPEELISSQTELEDKIEKELSKIYEDPNIKSQFDVIDNNLNKNKSTQEFRDIIKDNVFLIEELKNKPQLKKKLWLNSISQHIEEYTELINAYENAKIEIKKIILESEKEQENWKKVIDTFNSRFITFPFTLSVENQSDIILKDMETANIKFIPKNEPDIKKTHNEILQFVSSGEKRAIYLLNILFNIEILKNEFNNNPETKVKLLIFDDIADSFDYQNKYAIIDYLNDISKEDAFNILILTHNYDFFRTVKRKINPTTYIAYKESDKIEFRTFKISLNPFKDWRKKLDEEDLKYNQKEFISSIPFVRNLLELNGYDREFVEMTELLHFKNEATTNKTIEDIKGIYEKLNINLKYTENCEIYPMIMKCAQSVKRNRGFELKNKIILSIYVRLKAEEFIIKKTNTNIEEINTYQTNALINRYKEKYPNDNETLEILERVRIVSSEYIHLNSFMYEPLIDISDEYLQKLCDDLDNLFNEV